jgi:cell wall-associated NlpC family hydrolase
MRHSIQAGAFSQLENAVRLSQKLQKLGLETYYFADDDGLFKVRFGDYRRKEDALRRAQSLAAAGAIDVFYIVNPQQYAPAAGRRYGDSQLRTRLVNTARRYIGLPYRWGGDSPDEGFDCSGLAMTVYRVNGLNLPRNSRQQYRAGSPIARHSLRPGDLVFFNTSGRGVSHVGIYTGGGKFIHAPKSGRTIQNESLSNGYFASRFMGARTYLR